MVKGYINECLESISAQIISTPDVSVDILIGIDNCEKTAEMLNVILPLFSNIRAFYFHEHLGPYIIRNTLSVISDADYLVFFDADDIMPKAFLQNLIKPFEMYDIIRFGLRDFIEIIDESKNLERVFDKSRIRQFQNNVVKQHNNSLGVEPSFFNKLYNLRKSKYFKIDRYINFFYGMFKRKKSGVFAIKRSLFYDMNGFRAWPVQADVEFIARAKLLNIKQFMLPKEVDFLRRIHTENLTSDYHVGMDSQIRKTYQLKSKKSMYENEKMVTNFNYTEINISE